MKKPVLSRVANETIRALFGAACYSKAGLAEGTNVGKFLTAATATFAIDGMIFTKAATDNLSFSTTNLSVHGPSQRRHYLVQIDAAGNITTKQSAPWAQTAPAPGSGNENGVTYVPASKSISGVTQAFRPRVTSTAHGLQTGDTIMLHGLVGPSILNGVEVAVRRVDANNFDLMINVDGRTLPAYTAGGFWTEVELARACLGAITVETNSSTTFTPDTTDLSAAGLTVSYADFGMVPERL